MIAMYLTIWLLLIAVPMVMTTEETRGVIAAWIIWVSLGVIGVVLIFTGVPIPNNEGQYKGYVVAVERNGAIFKGWNVYLKTELESSNEDLACINRSDAELIKQLQEKVNTKENVLLEYRGVIQYAIGECPGSDWMVTKIIQ